MSDLNDRFDDTDENEEFTLTDDDATNSEDVDLDDTEDIDEVDDVDDEEEVDPLFGDDADVLHDNLGYEE